MSAIRRNITPVKYEAQALTARPEVGCDPEIYTRQPRPRFGTGPTLAARPGATVA